MKHNEELSPISEKKESITIIDVDNKIIQIHGEITIETGAVISECIKNLDSGHPAPITVEINSNGGLYGVALGIITVLSNCENEIITDIKGIAYSAGAYIALCGNKRYISKFGSIMYHSPAGGFEGDESWDELEIFAKASQEHYARLVSILLKDTKLSIEKYLQNTEREWYLNPKEAKRLGVIHDIY